MRLKRRARGIFRRGPSSAERRLSVQNKARSVRFDAWIVVKGCGWEGGRGEVGRRLGWLPAWLPSWVGRLFAYLFCHLAQVQV